MDRAQIARWHGSQREAFQELREQVERMCSTLTAAEVSEVTRHLAARCVVEDASAEGRWAVVHVHHSILLQDLAIYVAMVLGGDDLA